MITASPKVIRGWAMYDWANSVYNLVITTTFFPIYFTAATKKHFGSEMIPLFGRKFVNSSIYSYSLAAAYLLISLFYPILTSVADTRGNKKNFMRFFCYMGAAGCGTLYLFDGSNLWLGILAFMFASMGYVGSLVFYNAYLPEIAAPEDQDRVSAKGYAYGYVGSVLLQLIGFVLLIALPEKQFFALRLNFLMVGLWWAGFAQITFAVLPKVQRTALKQVNVFTEGFAEVKKVFREIKQLPVLKKFLRGFFFYSMGVQTVMLAASLFGSKLLHLEDTKLIVTIVAIQLVAIVGALFMSRLSARYGNLRVLMGVVVFWILLCIAAYETANFADRLKPWYDRLESLKGQKEKLQAAGSASAAAHASTATTGETASYETQLAKTEAEISLLRLELAPRQTPIEYSFYALALGVGLVMGGIQSLSRSTYSKLMPETKDTASYFSYFDLTEKIAIVIGMFCFGFIDDMTHSMKNSVISLTVFFLIGLGWLYSALRQQKQLAEPIPAHP